MQIPATVADLIDAPYNPRTIDDAALRALGVSMQEFGDISGLVYNVGTGRLVAGHQRKQQLRPDAVIVDYMADPDDRGTVGRAFVLAHHHRWPIRFVDWPEAKEKAANAAANSPLMAGTFTDGLRPIIDELKIELPDLTEALRLPELLPVVALAGNTDPDECGDLPAEPKTRSGDLWRLGDHRLLCGDSTNAGDVARLVGKEKPFLMVTDPPYGVEYDPEWRNEAAEKGLISFADRREGKVQNDDKADWRGVYALFAGDVAYVWHDGRHAAAVILGLAECGLHPRSQIIWAKPSLVISRGHYHWQHEPCWYVVRKGMASRWCGDRSQSTIWEISNAIDKEDNTNHGTQKPVECMARPIRNHGAPGDIVYDPFLGSGTTLIAAEQYGRRCFAIEIEPAYVDMAVARWEKFTGKTAVLEAAA